MTSRSTAALRNATRRRREIAEKAVADALRQARKAGKPVTFTTIAAAAGVSTDFIYRHPDLRGQVEALRNIRTPGQASGTQNPDADAAASTLIRRLSQELVDQRKKSRRQIADLEQALAAAHGELLELRRRETARDDDTANGRSAAERQSSNVSGMPLTFQASND